MGQSLTYMEYAVRFLISFLVRGATEGLVADDQFHYLLGRSRHGEGIFAELVDNGPSGCSWIVGATGSLRYQRNYRVTSLRVLQKCLRQYELQFVSLWSIVCLTNGQYQLEGCLSMAESEKVRETTMAVCAGLAHLVSEPLN